MSVVGLTLGIGANATRPSAASAASVATSASVFDDGCVRSYQVNPASRTSPRIAKLATSHLTRSPPAGNHGPRAVSLCRHLRRAQQRRAVLGRERTAAEHARRLRGEV